MTWRALPISPKSQAGDRLQVVPEADRKALTTGQGLTLPTFQGNVSTVCGIRWLVSVMRTAALSVMKTAQVEVKSGQV
jgi:hypothetical protein